MRGDGAGSGYKKRCTRFKLVALCSPSLQLPGAIATAVGVLTLNQGHWHAKPRKRGCIDSDLWESQRPAPVLLDP